MSNLLHLKCKALEGADAMGPNEVRSHLAQVSGWHLNEGAIEKTFSFKN
jgi:4a-hydroxytetrahydrobiopterin dehydratase